MRKREYLSRDDKKSSSYIDAVFDFLLSHDNKKYQNPEAVLRDFFSEVERICVSSVRREILIYLMVHGAASITVIFEATRIPIASIYREVRRLVEMGLVECFPPRREGKGRPSTVYGRVGCSPEEVVRAFENDRARKNPSYPVVKRLTQLILEDYFTTDGPREISWKEILKTTRDHCKGYYNVDIANLVARELSREGIKIWR